MGWICALSAELLVARAMFDDIHPNLPQPPNDENVYQLGEIEGHNVVIGCFAYGVYGRTSAATVALQMIYAFPGIRCVLLVGIGSGVPSENVDMRLGDVVVGMPDATKSVIEQYDIERGEINTGSLNKPPEILLLAVARLKAQHNAKGSSIPKHLSKLAKHYPYNSFGFPGQQFDRLFKTEHSYYAAREKSDYLVDNRLMLRLRRDDSKPVVHYGKIASTNKIINDANARDRLTRNSDILCFEMEAIGLQDGFPCLAIRGICDYADSHKNSIWRHYAAATAAAFAKELLINLPVEQPAPSDISLFKDSPVYNTFISSISRDQLLNRRATHNSVSPSWKNNVADLLKRLGLDSSLPTQRRLARILDVDVGPDDSVMQNIALHQAIMQELAKNNGKVPTIFYNHHLQLFSSSDESGSDERASPAKFYDEADTQSKKSRPEKTPRDIDVRFGSGSAEIHDGELLKRTDAPFNESKHSPAPSENDRSEILSIFSEITGNSSMSSLDGSGAADRELAYLFLTDTKLKPLFQRALSKVNLEKFSRNIKRLIVHYGRNLESEASEELQRQAAKYVRRSAHRITIHIKSAIILEVRVDELSKPKQVDDWLVLFQRSKKSPSPALEAETEDRELSSESEEEDEEEHGGDEQKEEQEIDEELSPQALLEMQKFLTTAKAFKTLETEFHEWLTAGKRQSLAAQEQQPPGTHGLVSTQNMSGEIISKNTESPQEISSWTRFGLSPKPWTWKGMMLTIWHKIVPLLWTKPPEGYKRITWLSAIGRPLYIDCKEIAEGAAQKLQERFRSSAVETSSSSSQPSSGTSISLNHVASPSAANFRTDVGKYSLPDQRRNSSTRASISDHDTSLACNERRYLLLCFSTHKSETFRQIDVTELKNDQYLFSCIHDTYREIKSEECWHSKFAFVKSLRLPTWMLWILGDLHFYTPKEVNFVSVSPSLSFDLVLRWHRKMCINFTTLRVSNTITV